MLFNCAQDRAVSYLLNYLDSVPLWGDTLQMEVLELIQKVFRTNPGEKGKLIQDRHFFVAFAFDSGNV